MNISNLIQFLGKINVALKGLIHTVPMDRGEPFNDESQNTAEDLFAVEENLSPVAPENTPPENIIQPNNMSAEELSDAGVRDEDNIALLNEAGNAHSTIVASTFFEGAVLSTKLASQFFNHERTENNNGEFSPFRTGRINIVNGVAFDDDGESEETKLFKQFQEGMDAWAEQAELYSISQDELDATPWEIDPSTEWIVDGIKSSVQKMYDAAKGTRNNLSKIAKDKGWDDKKKAEQDAILAQAMAALKRGDKDAYDRYRDMMDPQVRADWDANMKQKNASGLENSNSLSFSNNPIKADHITPTYNESAMGVVKAEAVQQKMDVAAAPSALDFSPA